MVSLNMYAKLEIDMDWSFMNSKKYDGALYSFEYVETLKDIILDSSSRYPNRSAYMYKNPGDDNFRHITYFEFKKNIDNLGTALIDMGLEGSKIAIIGENSHKWVMSYFAVVTGVGVVVPLDKNLEIGEIINLMKRADIELIFTSKKMYEKVSGAFSEVETLKSLVVMDGDLDASYSDSRILNFDSIIETGERLLAAGDRRFIDKDIKQEDLSTILFTSGTTGLAKGVMLSHMNLTQNVFNMSKYFRIPIDKDNVGRVLSILPMHHAYEMTCSIMTTFYQGGTIVICEGLKHIQKNFKETECSVMLGVPLIFETIYKKVWKQAKKTGKNDTLRRAIAISKKLNLRNNQMATRRMFDAVHSIFGPRLYALIAGGAAIDPKVIIEFEAMGIPMLQGYGMTECAPIIAVNQDRYGKASSVGRAMPGTEIRIVDKDEFGIGEIICKGPSVMIGYYKDPENTKKAIKDGWLYTGDYGYIDEEGFLYITGRKKNVIVTKGGKNIFPEEVEYYLLLDEHIVETMVYGKEDSIKGDLICTAIIYPDFKFLESEGAKKPSDIYKVLRAAVENANAKMPPYKRVKKIEIRDKEFIKTTTLKIKRFEKENYDYIYSDGDFVKKRF